MYLLYHETVLDGKAFGSTDGSFNGSLVLLMVLWFFSWFFWRKGLFVEMWSEG